MFAVVNKRMRKAKAIKRDTITVAVRLDVIDYRRLLAILKRDHKYLNQSEFVRDAIIEKITKEE